MALPSLDGESLLETASRVWGSGGAADRQTSRALQHVRRRGLAWPHLRSRLFRSTAPWVDHLSWNLRERFFSTALHARPGPTADALHLAGLPSVDQFAAFVAGFLL